MRDVYKKAKYIIWKLCASVSVLLLMWVPQVVARTGCVCGDRWDFKPSVEAQAGRPLAGRHHKALWVMSSAARAGFPH